MSPATTAPESPVDTGNGVGLRASYYAGIAAVIATVVVYYGVPETSLPSSIKIAEEQVGTSTARPRIFILNPFISSQVNPNYVPCDRHRPTG